MVVQLTSLFGDSTSLLLAYSVPLLLFSAVLTFSGTFLTLDRTRSFSPRSDATSSLPGAFEKGEKIRHWTFHLGGGVGGLASGYVFGLHASTFLSLLIQNETSSASLTPTTFLIVWLFSIIPPIILGGRWKMAALTFIGICGGITLTIAISIITHPSLGSRVVLASVITPLVTLLVVVPSALPSISESKLAHSTARFASSCLGAFSMTVAIALLTRSTLSYSWANAWDRLWIANGSGWGTSRERGFDALFCVLWASGSLCDWALKRWIGEDPDEKWDTYLAEYSSALPNVHGRAGNFAPLRSWWTRLLDRLHLTSTTPARPREILFPNDGDFSGKADYVSVPGALLEGKPARLLSREDLRRSLSPEAYAWDAPASTKAAGVLRRGKSRSEGGFRLVLDTDPPDAEAEFKAYDVARKPTILQKVKNARTKRRWKHLTEGRRRAPVEFRPKDGFSSDSDAESSTDDDELKTPFGTPQKDTTVRVFPLERMNSSATTLSGTTVHPSSSSGHDSNNVTTPDVLDVDSEKARLKNMKATFGGIAGPARPIRSVPEYSDVEEDVTADYVRNEIQPRNTTPGWKPEFLKRASLSASERSSTPVGAVPMTPSLVNALGRIAKAKADAYGPHISKDDTPDLEHVQKNPSGARRDHITIAMEARDHIAGLPVIEDGQKRSDGGRQKWDSFWSDIQAKATEA